MSDIPTEVRQSSLGVSEEAINEISSQVTNLVLDYFSNVSTFPVIAKNYAGKTIEEVDAKLAFEGVPLEKLIAECRTIMNLSRHNGHPALLWLRCLACNTHRCLCRPDNFRAQRKHHLLAFGTGWDRD